MVKAKILRNKRNNQLLINIPKRKLLFLKDRRPKSVELKFKEEDFEF